jgi:arylsulfatase A-like enzyme
LELGFEYYFGVPVSNNWPPFVWVENDEVVGRRPGEMIRLYGDDGMLIIESIGEERVMNQIGQMLLSKAISFLETNQGKEPFFLYYATCAIHHPHAPGTDFLGTSRAGAYGDFIHEFDGIVGSVMRCLEKLGVQNNTLVLVTSDNGGWTDASEYYHWTNVNGSLRGQKGQIYEGGHRIPLIVRWPGQIPEGRVCEKTVCLTDVMATVAAVLETPLPEDSGEDSLSFLPLLLNPESGHSERETLVHNTGGERFAVRKGPWKLILKDAESENRDLATNSEIELYNLEEDLGETTDLSQQRPEIVSRLRSLLEEIRKTGTSRPDSY